MRQIQEEVLAALRSKFGISGQAATIFEKAFDGILFVFSVVAAAALCFVEALTDGAKAFASSMKSLEVAKT